MMAIQRTTSKTIASTIVVVLAITLLQPCSINASDPDVIEYGGKTYVYFAVGDQRSWMNVKRAVYDGPLDQFLHSWFTSGGIPDHGTASESNK